MKRFAIVLSGVACCAAGAFAAQAPVPTQWGTVSEPSLPGKVCATLAGKLTTTGGSIDALDTDPLSSQPDTVRIQNAIDNCSAGYAVVLAAGLNGKTGFLTGPLTLKSGVTLWIHGGVTLFASRNPADYDTGAGTCGTADTSSSKTCKPLIEASSTTGSGIVGAGIIDGRGGSILTSGANAGKRSWWDVAYQNKSQGLNQHNPRMLQIDGGSNFTLFNVTLQNSPNFHVVSSGLSGFTVWGVKVVTPSSIYTQANYACPSGTTPDVKTPATCFTPDTVKNTDGIDPGQSTNVLIAYSYISTGDDHIAIKAHSSGPVKNVTIAHNHLYYGHGMSIGSETDTGVDQVAVRDMTIDGGDSGNGNGLRIKSDSSRGGAVTNISYSNVCMRNVRRPLVFDPFYSSSTGSKYPDFANITLSNVHNLGSSKYAGGLLTFLGYEANSKKYPLTITLNNVVFDSAPSFEPAHNGGSVSPAAAHFTFGPGAVSFAGLISPSSTSDVTVVNNIKGTSTPRDCSTVFVDLKSVAPTSPF
jgi:polygalacturonase